MAYQLVLDDYYKTYAGCFIDHARLEDSKGMLYPHFHHYYEFYFLVSGSRKYFLSTKISTLQPNQLLIIEPNKPHQVTVNLNIPYERYVLYVTPQLMQTICKENPFLQIDKIKTGFFDFSSDHFSAILLLLDKILVELARRDVHSPNLIKNTVFEILVQICRNGEYLFVPTDEGDIRIQSTLDYIMENYAEPITMLDCAEFSHLSPSYFSRVFQKATAMTFREFLNRTRVDKACELLKDTSESMSTIAFTVGFSSESYFGVVFKQIKGCSPIAYRAKAKKDRFGV